MFRYPRNPSLNDRNERTGAMTAKGYFDAFPRPKANARCPFSYGTFAGTHMWTAPVSQGLQREMTFWSIAVICPAFVCGTDGRWPRWGARIRSQTRQ